jgi:hypothetical protein
MKQQVSLIARDLELLAHENSKSRLTKDSSEEKGEQNCEKPEKHDPGARIGGWF